MDFVRKLLLVCSLAGVAFAFPLLTSASGVKCSPAADVIGCNSILPVPSATVLPTPSVVAEPAVKPVVAPFVIPSYDPEYKRLWEVERANDVRKGWTKNPKYAWMLDLNSLVEYSFYEGLKPAGKEVKPVLPAVGIIKK